MKPTVLIIDDALFMRRVIRGILEDNGYQVVAEAASGIEAMRILHEHTPDIVILDIILPDSSGLDLIKSIIEAVPSAKIAICSALGQDAIVKKALDLGASAFIQKPLSSEKVLSALAPLEK